MTTTTISCTRKLRNLLRLVLIDFPKGIFPVFLQRRRRHPIDLPLGRIDVLVAYDAEAPLGFAAVNFAAFIMDWLGVLLHHWHVFVIDKRRLAFGLGTGLGFGLGSGAGLSFALGFALVVATAFAIGFALPNSRLYR